MQEVAAGIVGEIIDPDACLARAVDDMSVSATDNSTGKTYAGAVDGNMDLKTSGSGDITVNGSCHDVTATISGSGDISGNLAHTGISTKTTGSGEIRL